MVTGMIMQGAILTNKSPVTLESVTPIARRDCRAIGGQAAIAVSQAGLA
jgi:hypothetical protein